MADKKAVQNQKKAPNTGIASLGTSPGTTVGTPGSAGTVGATTTRAASPTSPGSTRPYSKGPVLFWDAERDKALITAIADAIEDGRSIDPAELVNDLEDHAAFKDAAPGALTADKIVLRITKLRAQGVVLPRRTGGKYRPNVAELNQILGVELVVDVEAGEE